MAGVEPNDNDAVMVSPRSLSGCLSECQHNLPCIQWRAVVLVTPQNYWRDEEHSTRGIAVIMIASKILAAALYDSVNELNHWKPAVT